MAILFDISPFLALLHTRAPLHTLVFSAVLFAPQSLFMFYARVGPWYTIEPLLRYKYGNVFLVGCFAHIATPTRPGCLWYYRGPLVYFSACPLF